MTDLITLAEYKEYKDITNPNRDGRFTALISRVSDLIEHYCNRKFTLYAGSGNAKTEWHDGKTDIIYLKEFPVIVVESVKTSTDGGITQITLTEASSGNDGYFVDIEEGIIFSQIKNKKFVPSYNTPYRSLEVTYQAGYQEDEIPQDLKLAALDLVDYYEGGEKDPTKSLMGASIENPLPYIANSFPPHIRRILDLYRYSP